MKEISPRRIVALTAVATFTALSLCVGGAQQNPESFDQALHSVLTASRLDFRPLHGARIENKRRDFYFEAKIYLPEANYCRILKDEGSAYCCEFRVKTKADLEPLYEKLVARVEKAVGSAWTKVSKSGTLRNETIFGAEAKPIVHVILQRNPLQVYVLVLKAGSSKDGYTRRIPSTEEFVFR